MTQRELEIFRIMAQEGLEEFRQELKKLDLYKLKTLPYELEISSLKTLEEFNSKGQEEQWQELKKFFQELKKILREELKKRRQEEEKKRNSEELGKKIRDMEELIKTADLSSYNVQQIKKDFDNIIKQKETEEKPHLLDELEQKIHYMAELIRTDDLSPSEMVAVQNIEKIVNTQIKVQKNRFRRFRKITLSHANGCAVDLTGQVIGIWLSDIRLPNYNILSSFDKLTFLSLQRNELSDITFLTDLNGLKEIFLDGNQISDLIPLSNLHNLFCVELRNNQISRLPSSLAQRDLEYFWDEHFNVMQDKGINLYNNPLETPPVEIIKQGKQAVFEWFKAEIEGESMPLNEVKVLLVGDGGAGKTSLIKQILRQKFDKYELQTHGINIRLWETKTRIKVRFWDFGGQEIMHATHQFFLSKRSLYILVLDGRKDDKTEYWLKHIESFGGDSPILVVLNKMDENPGFEVNRQFLQQKYPNIKGFFRTSCATEEGIQQFHDRLTWELKEVELIHTQWPKNWFKVKTQLEGMTENFINRAEYQTICNQHFVTETAQQTLVEYLNNLGVIIHFKDFGLDDTHVLNPHWVTEAVYRIINSPILANCKGVLPLSSLDNILKQQKAPEKQSFFDKIRRREEQRRFEYPHDKYRYLIDLMRKFELCYELDRERVLIPDLLDVQEPTFDFDYANALHFRFDYDFLPRSIMPRFIVRLNQDIKDNLRWRTGVVLEDRDMRAVAVVKSDDEEKRISIWVNGERRREYFAVLRKTLRDIHNSFEKLNVTEIVPLPDHPEITVEYQEIIGLERMGETHISIGKLGKKYLIRSLLDGIERAEDRVYAIRPMPFELHQDLADFLTSLPGIAQRANREALLYNAGIDVGSVNIDIDLAPAQFVAQLLDTLWKYGKLDDNRNAIEAILEATKGSIGSDRRVKCDKLIMAVQSAKC